MAVGGAQGESVELFELLDFFEGVRGEGGFAFEGVEDDAFEEVAEGHILLLGDGFEDFEEAFFDADAGLDAIDFDEEAGLGSVMWYKCTMVLMYVKRKERRPAMASRRPAALSDN